MHPAAPLFQAHCLFYIPRLRHFIKALFYLFLISLKNEINTYSNSS